MIFIYIFLALLVLSVAGAATMIYFKKVNGPALGLCVGIAAVCFIVMLAAGINQLDTDSHNQANLKQYNELVLYYDVVSQSNDELLRWNYYEKCQKWNAAYTNYLLGRESKWRAAWFGAHDYDNCDFINLELRRE